jgi:hypothetical protein
MIEFTTSILLTIVVILNLEAYRLNDGNEPNEQTFKNNEVEVTLCFENPIWSKIHFRPLPAGNSYIGNCANKLYHVFTKNKLDNWQQYQILKQLHLVNTTLVYLNE